MSGTRRRQVARLERLALPYIKEKRRDDEQRAASVRETAHLQAANLALLILHGDPRIGEPLIYAWRRSLESPAWIACCKKHSYCHPYQFGKRRRVQEGFFDRQVADYFRKYFLSELPGGDETEKLNLVFARAPMWLLWYTHVDVIGGVLGLKVRDLSNKSHYARPLFSFMKLPDGPFEWCRLPDGAEDEWYASAQQHTRAFPDDMTPRERIRALAKKDIQMSGGSCG